MTRDLISDSKLNTDEKAKRVVKALQGLGADSYSVFGSFEGRGLASASSVEANVGNGHRWSPRKSIGAKSATRCKDNCTRSSATLGIRYHYRAERNWVIAILSLIGKRGQKCQKQKRVFNIH